MLDQFKNWFKNTEKKYNSWTDAWKRTKWYKSLSITTGVFWNLALLLAIILVAGGVFAASVGAGYFASLVDSEELRTPDEMRSEIFSYEETSEIFFADGIYLGKLRTDLDREEIRLEDVSDYAIDAVLATEDEYFMDHDGIVPKAILRGLFQDVSNSDSQTGGSTLTQQLVKNQILTNEVSYERKAKEILLAMRLEHFMEKDEIFEAYLNIIPYGRSSAGTNIAGIETAAKSIFNVSSSELNLPQAAFIAGIPKAPYSYTPYTSGGGLKEEAGLQPGLNRMLTVLYRMRETNVITTEEYDAAIAYDIVADFRQGETRSYDDYPYITVELERRASRIIMDILAEENGIDPVTLTENDKLYEEYAILADRAVRSNGYRIHSTIDKEMYEAQKTAAESYESYGLTRTKTVVNSAGEERERQFPVQVGGMTLENDTGRILSFIGGRDHAVENLNHATQAFRSVGSTVKPLLVYAPAVELGAIGAGSPVVDVKFEHEDSGGVMWEPSNFFADSEQGIMPARDALAESQNLPAIRLFAQIQNQMPIQYMAQTGFSRLTEASAEQINSNYSSALGGGVEGSVEEVTASYMTFANEGRFKDAYMIDRIEDAEGNVIFEEAADAEGELVFTPQTTYILTDMMREVFNSDRGTATRANNLLNFNTDFAGKTGTTQDAKDVWLVGYNPNITMTVWLGYGLEEFRLNERPNSELQPSTRVNQVWARVMNATYEVNPELVDPEETFQQPDGVVERSFCGISGLAPSSECSDAGLVRTDLFNENAMLPTEEDDSFTTASYTTVNGNRVAALSSTPREFVSGGGVGVSEDFIERIMEPFGGDASTLFPNNSRFSSVVSASRIEPQAGAPSTVNASLNGNTITWSNSASTDVVGYRVYRSGGSRVTSISENQSNSYSLPGSGGYYVVAVDITGMESSASNTVTIARAAAAPTPAPVEEEEDEPVESSPPPAESGTVNEEEEEEEEDVPAEPDAGDDNGSGDTEETEPPAEEDEPEDEPEEEEEEDDASSPASTEEPVEEEDDEEE